MLRPLYIRGPLSKEHCDETGESPKIVAPDSEGGRRRLGKGIQALMLALRRVSENPCGGTPIRAKTIRNTSKKP